VGPEPAPPLLARPCTADEGGGEELNRDQKAQAIAEIAERLSSTDTVIAAAFHGLSVREVENLRGTLREADGQFQVVKNTLARRACNETGSEALLEHLEGQTALVWAAGDAAAIAKTLATFGKATDSRLSMKGGILDGNPITAAELAQLASLPPRDELLARLVAGVASPLQGTANALGSLISGMARALGAYHAQRESEPSAAGEAPVTEADSAPVPEAEEVPAPTAEAPGDAEAPTEDTAEAAQEPAADDTTDAEPAADETTEGDN
jgi:large subunit ribosomal protein L10